MELSPKIYLKLFDLLVEAITSEGYPEVEKKPTLQQIVKATVKIKGKAVNISEEYLLSPFPYFINLRTQAWKGNDVSIQEIRLVKSIEYIEQLPENKKYFGHEWADAAIRLLNEFVKKYNLNENEIPFEENGAETVFLKIVAERKDLFESSLVKTLVTNYFTALNNQKLLDAWDLLSPDLRKNSLWDGEFLYFEITSSFFTSTNLPLSFSDFRYEYQKVIFNVFLETEASVFDVNAVFEKNKQEQKFVGNEKIDDLRREVKRLQSIKSDMLKMSNLKANLSFPPYRQKISKMKFDDLERMCFQQHYLVVLLNLQRQTLSVDEMKSVFNFINRIKYKRKRKAFGLRMKISCKYFQYRWLIDEIRIENEYPRHR